MTLIVLLLQKDPDYTTRL